MSTDIKIIVSARAGAVTTAVAMSLARIAAKSDRDAEIEVSKRTVLPRVVREEERERV
jgi:hypothetical protein